jgi:hypothetical protein
MSKKSSKEIAKTVARPILRTRGNRSVLFLLLLSFLLFGVWGIRLLVSDVTTMREELAKGETYKEVLRGNITALEEAEISLTEAGDKLLLLEKAVPDSRSQPELMEEVALDGGKARFYLHSLNFPKSLLPEGGKKAIYSIPFEADFKGGVISLQPLLEELAKGRLILLESIQYGEEEDRRGPLLRVKIQGKGFFYE